MQGPKVTLAQTRADITPRHIEPGTSPPIEHRMRVREKPCLKTLYGYRHMEKELLGKYTMPGIGFGTLGNTGDAGCALVEAALAEGYRYIDTSRFYGNEEAVGSALARSSVPRIDICVTTKLYLNRLSFVLQDKAHRASDTENFIRSELEIS